MEIDLPDVVAEVTAAFERYEAALVANDLATLDALFWASPKTVRYGIAENLYGIAAIRAFRAQRPPLDLAREVLRRVVTTFGRDLATTAIDYRRAASGRRGRQMQTWVRLPEGWRIVAAHVSLLPEPAP
jgi:hypothetical protein